MKVGIVVQRYGADVSGGAELHARYVAEHLAKHVDVEVLTTCATDYITWRNALNAGPDVVNGVAVRRFPVVRERDPEEFGSRSRHVFTTTHSFADELAWLDAEGPTSTALVEHIRTNDAQFDFFIFFSFRYYHAYHGIRVAASKAILVPTAERDGALGLSIFGPAFRSVRAFMYNSFEERALIQAVAGNSDIPGVVVGVGSEIPPQSNPIRFRQKFRLRDRFAIYIGRIDENKGCAELFDYFQRYARMLVNGLHLVLIGHPIIPVPRHPRIHHLGFISDQDKFDALAAAELLVMPSYFESLSMVALEAWAMGKPVLANGQCDVLKGQCIRSNGGLYYDTFAEFVETLRAIDFNPTVAAALGRNGRDYFQRHYTWPIIERKYLDMLERLRHQSPTAAMEPWPGWLARRRRTLPPANEILARLPKGAVLPDVEARGPRGSGSAGVSVGVGKPVAPVVAGANTDVSALPRRPERTERPRQGDRRPQPRGRQQRNRRPGGRPPRRPGNR
ncbi:MAG TPA: glycosyltransferase family 4 protein [Vicinamibacterales bacterium]|nr:glycosyltransferase family 4 protein [Vicinamibacterales bacterium]